MAGIIPEPQSNELQASSQQFCRAAIEQVASEFAAQIFGSIGWAAEVSFNTSLTVLIEHGGIALDEPSKRLSYERLLPYFGGELV